MVVVFGPVTKINDVGKLVFGNIDESYCILHENVSRPTYNDFGSVSTTICLIIHYLSI